MYTADNKASFASDLGSEQLIVLSVLHHSDTESLFVKGRDSVVKMLSIISSVREWNCDSEANGGELKAFFQPVVQQQSKKQTKNKK